MARAFVRASSQYVSISGVPDLTSGFTIGGWVRWSSLPSAVSMAVMCKGSNTSGAGRNFSFHTWEFFGRKLALNWSNGVNYTEYVTTAAYSPSVNQWYHLAASVDWTTNPDTVAMYVDGVSQGLTLQSGNTNDTGPALTGTQVTQFGGFHADASGYIDGRLAEMFVTGTVINVNQVKALAAGLAPDRLGVDLSGYWPLWGNESPEQDLSGNERNGTLVNSPTFATHASVMPFSQRFWRGISIDQSYQKARPTSDVSVGTWTTQAGGTTNLYQTVDEVSPDDADYVRSPISP